MKTKVEFRSHKFPPYEGEEEEINPGLWGRRLAEYLVRRLPEHDIEAAGFVAEDWGYYIPIENNEFKLAICCGHQYGDADEFLCFTDPSTPVVKKWFRTYDATVELTKLTDTLQRIFVSDPDIKDVVWSAE